MKRKKLMKALNGARKELIERTQLTDEMKSVLAHLIEESPESETKEEALEFLFNLPTLERINQLKWLVSEEHQANIEKDFQKGVIRNDIFEKDYKYRRDTFQETKDTPGATSSKNPAAKVKTIKVIKVEMEQQEANYEKIGLSVLLVMALSVAVQWLFGKCTKCQKRNQTPTPEIKIKTIEAREETAQTNLN